MAKPIQRFWFAGEPPNLVQEVELDHARCCKLLGDDIGDDRIVEILSSLGLQKTTLNAGISTWKIPSYRLDLLRAVDLIEEGGSDSRLGQHSVLRQGVNRVASTRRQDVRHHDAAKASVGESWFL